jgi:hypothetical protein
MVSIVGACFARSAQKQAKKAATLESRREAIKHIGEARFEVTNNGYVGDKAVNSIQEATKLAALVFNRKVKDELDAAYKTASSLNTPDRLKNQHSPENREFGKKLDTLLTRMSDEAALF